MKRRLIFAAVGLPLLSVGTILVLPEITGREASHAPIPTVPQMLRNRLLNVVEKKISRTVPVQVVGNHGPLENIAVQVGYVSAWGTSEIGEARSNGQGRAEVPIDGALESQPLSVMAGAEWFSNPVGAPTNTEAVQLKVVVPARVKVRLLDDLGTPVEGVHLVVKGSPAVTDANGVAEISHLYPGPATLAQPPTREACEKRLAVEDRALELVEGQTLEVETKARGPHSRVAIDQGEGTEVFLEVGGKRLSPDCVFGGKAWFVGQSGAARVVWRVHGKERGGEAVLPDKGRLDIPYY